MIDKLVLFGATGDLAGRLLLPAVAALHAADRLPEGFSLIGAAAEDWNEDRFRRHLAQHLEEHAAHVSSDSRKALLDRMRYRQVDVGDSDSVARVLSADRPGTDSGGNADAARPVAVYVALPPALFPPTVRTLGEVGLPAGSRIALEKPFGDDVSSARALNQLLKDVTGDAGERAVFRVDHTLGMATAANLIALRMANPVLEAVWNSTYVEEVAIFWDETLALEGRADYYDATGALKDVLQNHMLQLLSLVAMEPPAILDERELRDAKVGALRAVRLLTEDDVATRTRRARYSAGRLADTGGAEGQQVPDYAEEDGVDPGRGTETYAEVLLELDTPRWSGTRFRLRAGKALRARRKGVLLRFRTTGPGDRSGGAATAGRPGSELWIGIDGPDDLTLQLVGRAVDQPKPGWAALCLGGSPPPSALPPYSRVLLDLFDGDSVLSVRGDEAEQAWRVVTPIPQVWSAGHPPLLEYPAGSDGPAPLSAGEESAATG